MSQEDPFAEPEDTERTVIRPNPGGRRPVASSAAPASAPAAPASSLAAERSAPTEAHAAAPRPEGTEARTGMNPLNAAASTLFALIGRIANRARHSDPDRLRDAVVAEIRAFERRAISAGIDPQQIKVARYAICATVDDVVLNTPWGGQSIWAQKSMVGTFHRETVGGDRFYDLLARLEQNPGNNLALLEFLYMCLSLGFQGRLRVSQGGQDRHQTIRLGLAGIIRAQRGEIEQDLSPHWRGVERRHRPLSAWKAVWIAAAATAFLLTFGYLGVGYALSRDTQRLVGTLDSLDPGIPPVLERRAPPVIAPPVADGEVARVSRFLSAEIEEGLVDVFQEGNTLTVRIKGAGMFASGSPALKPAFETPLQRVAEALDSSEGPVIVVGHSDNVPIRSGRFPSNLALSLARAEEVMGRIAGRLSDPARLKAEGRADREPIASNDTREGRAANRRIEIVLVREESRT